MGATRSSRVSICFKGRISPIIPSDRCLSQSVVMVFGVDGIDFITNASEILLQRLGVTMGRVQATYLA